MTGDNFDWKAYFRSIADPEERAQAIHESGWAGDPEIADIEAAIALPEGGKYQKLLAAQRRPRPPTPKRAVQRYERLRAAWPHRYGPKQLEGPERKSVTTDAGPVEAGQSAQSTAGLPANGAADRELPAETNVPKEHGIFRAFNIGPPEPGSLAESINRYVYEKRENEGKLQPGDVPPPGYRPSSVVSFDKNPFLRSKSRTRSSDMTKDEALRLYRAISFAMWQHGALMTSHVIILWETFRVHEHDRATKILSNYFGEAKKWAKVGTIGEARQRRRERTGEGFTFRYVYVHQNAPRRGFHTHILCTVPRRAAKSFAAWSMKALARLARHPGDRRSVRVVPSYARTEDAAVARGWWWFSYIAKQLDQNAVWGRKDEPGRSLRTIFRVWPHETALPVASAQLVGGSQDIWTGAQDEAQFEPLLERYEYDQLFAGLEMAEWRKWCSSEEMRKVYENLII